MKIQTTILSTKFAVGSSSWKSQRAWMVFSQQLPLLDANHDERNEGDNGAGFELEQRHIAAEFFKAGLDTVNLFGLGLFGGDFSWVSIFIVSSSWRLCRLRIWGICKSWFAKWEAMRLIRKWWLCKKRCPPQLSCLSILVMRAFGASPLLQFLRSNSLHSVARTAFGFWFDDQS